MRRSYRVLTPIGWIATLAVIFIEAMLFYMCVYYFTTPAAPYFALLAGAWFVVTCAYFYKLIIAYWRG